MITASSSTLKASFLTSGESWLYLGLIRNGSQHGPCKLSMTQKAKEHAVPAQTAALARATATKRLGDIRPGEPGVFAAPKLLQDFAQTPVLLFFTT